MNLKRLVLIPIAALGLSFSLSALGQEQGGEMIVSFQDDLSTLDPAIGYDWQNWSIIKSIFDGLMDYEAGTTNLTPHLADDYEVSEDGRSYTFALREGVVFHNGREMVAEDVKYSLERVLDPETQSPGQGFYLNIAGAEAFIEGDADEVTGIDVLGPYEVSIELVDPDASFLHKLALNFAHVVPEEGVEAADGDFGHEPVGTGAFELGEWVLGQRVVLERNEDYFVEGRPYLDTVVFRIGVDQNVAFLQLQRDEVDVLGDGIPSARFTEVMDDPQLSEQVVRGEQLHTGYVTINTQMEPFDDPDVRKALNMAINKDRIVRVINGRADPANQILPPLMPGYAEAYEGYPYDPEGARELLADAGHPDGFDTTLYAFNVSPNDRIAQAIQQDLSEIGVNAEVRAQAQSTVIEAGGAGQAPLLWSGGMAWIADYPYPDNFYWPILSCRGAEPGGWNWAKYCNEEMDERAAAADAMVRPDQEEERLEAYRDVFVDIMAEDAPWIPIFNETRFTMHSTRVDGEAAVFADPIHIPVHYGEVYRVDE